MARQNGDCHYTWRMRSFVSTVWNVILEHYRLKNSERSIFYHTTQWYITSRLTVWFSPVGRQRFIPGRLLVLWMCSEGDRWINEQGASVEWLLTEAGRVIGRKKSANIISSDINLKCIEVGLNLDFRGTPPPTLQDFTTRRLHSMNSYRSGKLKFNWYN
jgi:hypothetical protein